MIFILHTLPWCVIEAWRPPPLKISSCISILWVWVGGWLRQQWNGACKFDCLTPVGCWNSGPQGSALRLVSSSLPAGRTRSPARKALRSSSRRLSLLRSFYPYIGGRHDDESAVSFCPLRQIGCLWRLISGVSTICYSWSPMDSFQLRVVWMALHFGKIVTEI